MSDLQTDVTTSEEYNGVDVSADVSEGINAEGALAEPVPAEPVTELSMADQRGFRGGFIKADRL